MTDSMGLDSTKLTIKQQHRLRWLPDYLTAAKMWEKLEETLTDFRFIEDKCAAGMAYGLIEDCNRALDRVDIRAVTQVRQALSLASTTLAERPALGIQAIYNRLCWFDELAPRLKAGLDEARIRLDEQPFWIRAEASLPGTHTHSALNIPLGTDAHVQSLALDGHAMAFVASTRVPGETRAAGAHSDVKVELRDLSTGAQSNQWMLGARPVMAIALSEDGTGLAYADAGGMIRAHGMIASLAGRPEDRRLAYHTHLGVLAVRQDGALVAWNPERDRCVTIDTELPTPLLQVRIDRGGRDVFYIAGAGRPIPGQAQREPQVIGLATLTAAGWKTRRLPSPGAPVVYGDLDASSQCVLLLSRDSALRILDLATGEVSEPLYYQRREEVILTGAPEKCALGFADTRGKAFFATRDGHIGCWNWRDNVVERLEDYATRFDHTSLILFETIPPHGRLFLSTDSLGKTLTPGARAPQLVLARHFAAVSACFLTTSDTIVSASQLDKTVHWSSANGLSVLDEQAHREPSAICPCDGSEDVLIGTRQGYVWRQPPKATVRDNDIFMAFAEPVVSLFDAGNGCVIAAGRSARTLRVHLVADRVDVLWHSSGMQAQQKIMPAGSNGLYWSVRREHKEGGTHTVISLVHEANRDEVILSAPTLFEDVTATHDGETLCLAGLSVQILRRSGRRWTTEYTREVPVKHAAFLAGGDLLAVALWQSPWLEIWRISEGLPTAAAIDVPGEVSCLSALGNRIAVGFLSGELMSLRLQGCRGAA